MLYDGEDECGVNSGAFGFGLRAAATTQLNCFINRDIEKPSGTLGRTMSRIFQERFSYRRLQNLAIRVQVFQSFAIRLRVYHSPKPHAPAAAAPTAPAEALTAVPASDSSKPLLYTVSSLGMGG